MNIRLRKSVTIAAKRLDDLVPGWRKIIDWDRLDMSKGYFSPSYPYSCGCIIAQLEAYKTPKNAGYFSEASWIKNKYKETIAFQPPTKTAADPESLLEWESQCRSYWLEEQEGVDLRSKNGIPYSV